MNIKAAGRTPWIIVIATLVAMITVVLTAPQEQSMGDGIRVVYVHVALVWAGMLGFAINGLLGIVLMLSGRRSLKEWIELVGISTLLIFIASVLVSLLAEQINWGGILWQEPRNQAVFTVTAVAVIVHIVNSWLPWIRWRGLLPLALALFVLQTLPGAPRVLHPENPVRNSSSQAMQSTFLIMFALSTILGGWLVWYLRTRSSWWRTADAHS